MKKLILKGERVILRPLKVSDAENYVRWFADKQIMLYFNRFVWKISLEDEKKAIRKFQRSKININWAIEIKGKHIGGTGLALIKERKTASWGIVIGEKKEWGKEYAVEAAKLCLEYAFKKLKYERVELLVEMLNEKAIKAYKKVGFKMEGISRSYDYNKFLKKRIDMGRMSILREEWIKNK